MIKGTQVSATLSSPNSWNFEPSNPTMAVPVAAMSMLAVEGITVSAAVSRRIQSIERIARCGFGMRSKATEAFLPRKCSNVRVASSSRVVCARPVAMSGSPKEEEEEDVEEAGLGQRELKDYPPGLQLYETMAVLRPDISEEQRLALTQRYEEAIIASGGLDVEMFNRGMQPLAYNINTKNLSGVSNRYLDGIYLLFTYVTKPETLDGLQKRLNADYDVIRSISLKLKT